MTAIPVAISGFGAVSPLGPDAATFIARSTQGESGIVPITDFTADHLETRFAGIVTQSDLELAGGDKRLAHRKDRFVLLALRAAAEALDHAGLSSTTWQDPYRIGVVIGTGIGGIGTLSREQQVLQQRGPHRVSPFLIPRMIGNMASGDVALMLGAKGPTWTLATACATGASALHAAALLIRSGAADVVIAGGTESATCAITIAGFNAIGALSRRNHDPAGASRPFDRGRDGFVIAEGAGILVLESVAHVRRRGGPILALLAGCGSTDDAFHETNPDPSGTALAAAVRGAMAEAGPVAGRIGYINAHGTSTQLNDRTESTALRLAFGDAIDRIWVSSSKSMIGHTMGAAGALEAIASIAALRTGLLPPTINLDDPDPACPLRHVARHTVESACDAVVSVNMGFGGHNGCLVFSSG
jgi:beta-ketoacyl-acyl-carrier-protein synthase II